MHTREMKKPVNEMDVEVLDELIDRCEDAMVRPFSKKKVVTVEVKPEEEQQDEERDESEDGDKPDLSDEELDELIRLYQEKKGKE